MCVQTRIRATTNPFAPSSLGAAILVATDHDRIHLKTTHHKYAKYLELTGQTAAAIRNFERADTYKSEVPRMLFDQNRMEDLEDYIMQGNDTELLKWWAGYCESLGQFEKVCFGEISFSLSFLI